MASASDTVNSNASSTKTTTKSSSTKPTRYANLFYSPDYQQLFQKEIEDISLEILETAEMALSSFDYRTIEYIQPANSPVFYDDFGKMTSITSIIDTPSINSQTVPFFADKAYNINDVVISKIRDSVEIRPDIEYSSILLNYGYHSLSPDIIPYRAGYRADGSAYYDLEISIPNVGGVVGYNIYMIEEVDWWK